jgi:ferredoxin
MVTPPTILVDLAICCRSGVCAAFAPDLVTQQSDGTPVVLAPADDANAGTASIDEIVAMCPVGALSISPLAVPPVESP